MDTNVFWLAYNFDNVAQGTAFVNHCGRALCGGGFPGSRPCDYPFAHVTRVSGYAFVYGGDVTLYNNLFIAPKGYQKTEPIVERNGFVRQRAPRLQRPSSYMTPISQPRYVNLAATTITTYSLKFRRRCISTQMLTSTAQSRNEAELESGWPSRFRFPYCR